MRLVAWWWNECQGDLRRDIWLDSDGRRWVVRCRAGGAREVSYEFDRDYRARAMVDRLKATAPGAWKDITRLVQRPAATESRAGDLL